MENCLEMQKKSRFIAVFLLVCILVSVVMLGYVICLMAIRGGPQTVFTGFNWQDDQNGYFFGYICVLLIKTLAIILALVLAYTIFRPIGKGLSPFSPLISKRIRAIGVLLIVAATIAWPIGTMSAKAIWPESTVYTFLFRLDWGTLIVGFIISCLASIFRYGCLLQQESDETL